MKNILSKLSAKKVIAVYAMLALFGVSTVANASGNISYEAMHVVRNKTNNEDTYHASTSAKAGDEVRLMVYYHNKENENSGILAKDLNIRISLPTNEGTSHVSTSTVSGSNIATIVDTAVVNTSSNTKLVYVPGSATRKFDTGTNAAPNWQVVNIDDSIVGSGYHIAQQKPCYNFEESIVITAKVVEVEKPKNPVCVLKISKSEMDKDDGAVLSYTTQDATSASIDNGIGSVAVGSGSINVFPKESTRYTMTAKNDDKVVTCSADVIVKEKPIPQPPVTPPTTVVVTGKGNLPTSGPAEAAAGAVGLTASGGAAYAWMRSKKALLSSLKKIK